MFEDPKRMQELMSGFSAPWYIAAGWTIDLFLGKETRNHSDVDIAVWRDDQIELKKYLCGWQFSAVVPESGGFRLEDLAESDYVKLPVHELKAQNIYPGLNQLEVLLNERDGANWIYRRNRDVNLPLELVGFCSKEGIPYLNPIIVLLYKSKHNRPKDHEDFLQVRDKLDSFQRDWLKKSISACQPGHHWLSLL